MNENITENNTVVDSSNVSNNMEMGNSGMSSDYVVTNDGEYTFSTNNTDDGTVDAELVQSVLSESGMSVSSGDVSTYLEVEQQVDSEILGSLNTINSTLTLVLFFLLFQWIDKKVQAITRGMTNE